ncbi:hypothetical protein G6F22_014980 [Rhizopus arrhizus]|nr:hypothetical protein G6F22_014980 [Rhizopus arrhizus]
MTTSRIPAWPTEVEGGASVDRADKWQRDWRDNPRLGFLDKAWPMICTATGVVMGVAIVCAITRSTG